MWNSMKICLKMLPIWPISAAARPKSHHFRIFAKTTPFLNPISTHSRVFSTFRPPPKFSKPGIRNWALKRKVQIHELTRVLKFRRISWRSIWCMRVAGNKNCTEIAKKSFAFVALKSLRWNRLFQVFRHWKHAVFNVIRRHFHVDCVSKALRFRSKSQWSEPLGKVRFCSKLLQKVFFGVLVAGVRHFAKFRVNYSPETIKFLL